MMIVQIFSEFRDVKVNTSRDLLNGKVKRAALH